MTSLHSLRRTVLSQGLVLLLSFTALAPCVRAQIPGVSREQMWPAPTAEDWKKPCLIEWQRTWEDAVAVSKETGKAILVCINMDGEIASEHYAGIRYREPAKTKLYEPYVTVIASVYRHTPRDHDEDGNRIPCPRFGGVTCGEHIQIEPIIFEKFCEGKRIAPRHIMVELDKKETFDVFYAFDTDSVFNTIRDGITNRPKGRLTNIVRGDRSVVEKVNSPYADDQRAVETAYRKSSKAEKRALLEAALKAGENVPLDLLRMAVFDFDQDLASLARQALAQSQSINAIDLVNEALQVPMPIQEKQLLIAALERLASLSDRAQTLAVVHKGLGKESKGVKVSAWKETLAGGATYSPAPTVETLAGQIESHADVAKSTNPEAHISVAEAYLARAVATGNESISSKSFVNALLYDAKAAANKAEKLGAKGWSVNSILAVAEYYLGNDEEAYRRAEAAAKHDPKDPNGFNAMITLGLFVDHRRQQIQTANKAKKNWPGEWLSDVNSTYSILAQHPLADDSQVKAHFDFLMTLGGRRTADRILRQGLIRFPESAGLHARLRRRLLRRRGVNGLKAAYERMLSEAASPPANTKVVQGENLEWFAGYAMLAAGEVHRRMRQPKAAYPTYSRAIELLRAHTKSHPKVADSNHHLIALALGGRARLAYERGDDAQALADLLASFELSPSTAATLDGLTLSAVNTANMLRARLIKAKQDQPLAKLEAALKKLDPKLLELPAFERGGPRRPPGNR